tara:strand:+ start:434 stop:2401 length:1968 start_codon:yes stop_codon:yes gene_type:complete
VATPKETLEAQKLANEAIKEGNDLSRAFGRILDSQIGKQKQLSVAAKNTASIIQRMAEDKKSELDTESKLKKVKEQMSANAQEIVRYNKIGHTAIADSLKTNIKGMAVEKGMLQIQKMKEDLTAKIKENLTIGGILAAAVSIATKFGSAIDTIGQQFGSLSVMGKEFQTDLLRSSVEATKLGGSIQDVASITNTLASDFGMSVDEAAKLSSKVFDTSKALGLSSDESANLFGSLTQVANLSAEQAESLAEGAFQLARQRGVAPSAVLRDIAGSAEEIALFTKGGGDNIAEAAVQARSLGMSLSQTAKIAEGLLDFESSITKEVEASVLIGKQLNFQRAREAALSGDIAGAMSEVVKQVGSEQDFLNLNLIQRKALADSIGVSVGEMAKLVGQSDKLTLSGAMASGNFEDLLGEEGISNISKLSGQFAALGANLVNSVGPVLSVVASGLNAMLSPIASVLQGLEKMNALAPVLAGTLTTLGTAYLMVKANALLAASAQAKANLAAGGGIVKSIGLAIAEYFKGAALGSGATLGFGTIALTAIAAGAVATMLASLAKAKSVNDFTSGPGGITTMMGPAGIFSLNPRDSVLATTNPIPVRRVNEVGQNLSFGNAGEFAYNGGGGGGGEYVLRAEGNDLVARIAKGANFGGGSPTEGMA